VSDVRSGSYFASSCVIRKFKSYPQTETTLTARRYEPPYLLDGNSKDGYHMAIRFKIRVYGECHLSVDTSGKAHGVLDPTSLCAACLHIIARPDSQFLCSMCISFLLITHRSTVLNDQQIQLTLARPKHALHAP